MIPRAGILLEESFTATIGKRNDVTLWIEGERGKGLAIALGARRGSVAFFLSPVRAVKWYALWIAGFSVRSIRIGAEGVIHWRYAGLGRENLIRRKAVVLAKTEQAKLQAAPNL